MSLISDCSIGAVCMNTNGFFSYSSDFNYWFESDYEGKIIREGTLDLYDYSSELLCRPMYTSNGIIGIPFWGNHIVFWKHKGNNPSMIELPYDTGEENNIRKFDLGIIHEKELIMIPCETDDIVIYDLESNHIKKQVDLRRILLDEYDIKYKYLCAYGLYRHGNSIFWCVVNDNYVIEFNCFTFKVSAYHIDTRDGGIIACCGSGSFLYVVTTKKRIIQMDLESHVVEMLCDFSDYEINDWEKHISRLLFYKDKIMIIPFCIKDSIVYSLSSNRVSYFLRDEVNQLTEEKTKYVICYGDFFDGKILFYSNSNRFALFDCDKMVMRDVCKLEKGPEMVLSWVKDHNHTLSDKKVYMERKNVLELCDFLRNTL